MAVNLAPVDLIKLEQLEIASLFRFQMGMKDCSAGITEFWGKMKKKNGQRVQISKPSLEGLAHTLGSKEVEN